MGTWKAHLKTQRPRQEKYYLWASTERETKKAKLDGGLSNKYEKKYCVFENISYP